MAVTPQESESIRSRFERFRREGAERLFVCPVTSPYHAHGLCFCDAPFWRALGFYLKAGLMGWLIRLPFNRPKLWILRGRGAKIGKNVHIAVDVWIDPLFPDLLTIEDDVTVGVGAKIALHEFTVSQFRAGRVMIGKGAVIGGFSLIGCGVEIGAQATVAGGAVVGKDVPAGATALGNPARIVRPAPADPEAKYG